MLFGIASAKVGVFSYTAKDLTDFLALWSIGHGENCGGMENFSYICNARGKSDEAEALEACVKKKNNNGKKNTDNEKKKANNEKKRTNNGKKKTENE